MSDLQPRPNVLIDTEDLDETNRLALMAELQARDLLPWVRDLSMLSSADLGGLRAVVFARQALTLGRAKERLRLHAPRVFDAGVSVAVLAHPEDVDRYRKLDPDLDFPLPKDLLASALRPTYNVHPSAQHLANDVLQLRSHPVAGAIAPTNLEPTDALLLRRAFSDATSLTLSHVDPGKTAAVWRVDAVSGKGTLRPFLAKFAKRSDAEREFLSYVDYVRDFVPFSFRPSLVVERCTFGADRGLLVSQFIEDEQPLSEVILRHAMPGVLHNVFEHLLAGWWRHGVSESQNSRVLDGIRHWYDVRKKPFRLAALQANAAATDGHERLSVDALIEKLASLPAVNHRESVIHGDLHGTNVRVRGTDVYLIDYGSTGPGPLVADPAMLEASLVVDAGIRCHKSGHLDAWQRFVSERLLRAPLQVAQHRELRHEDKCLDCLGEAIRTIRLHALAVQAADPEYEQALLAAYVRMASFRDEADSLRNAVIPLVYDLTARAVAKL